MRVRLRCEELSVIIWDTRHQIKEVERLRQRVPIDPPGGVDILPQLNQDITQLLSSLVTRSAGGRRPPPAPAVSVWRTRWQRSCRNSDNDTAWHGTSH